MSDNAGNTELEHTMEIISSKKQKHNSKRRRCKKKKVAIPMKDDCTSSKLDDIVNFLCNAVKKNESETSIDSNPPMKIAKESPTNVGVHFNQNSKSNSINLPSTSAADLSELFENLQVHTSKNHIKSNNITEFLNIDLLKKSNCGTLSMKELKRLKQEKVKKNKGSNEQTDIPSDRLKEYFNLDLIRQSQDKLVISQIDSSCGKLVSEIQQTFCPSSAEAEENLRSNKHLTEYFNLNALLKKENNLVTSKESTSKLLVSELEEKLLKGQKSNKKSQKNKSKIRNKVPTESSCEAEMFNGRPQVFINSGLQHKKVSVESKPSSSPRGNKNKKRQDSSMCEEDTKFPDHWSPEQIKSAANAGVLISGIIRINQRNYKEAYITAPDKGMDILIEGLRDRNRALEGDEVYIVLKPKEHYRTNADNADIQRTAVVVGIKTFNHSRRAIGNFNPIKKQNAIFALFSPRDSRLPRIRIKRTNWPLGFAQHSEDFTNYLYFAHISKWNDIRFAEGKIIQEIGNVGDIESETQALLLKHDLNPKPYDEDLKQFLPPVKFKISKTDLENREDFRKDCVFTIDPATAVDLDDAVSLVELPNGNKEIGVHISDVSYFLKEGTPLDKAVSKRATTIYLVQRAYHMLPLELCQLCSLTPGEDKLSFSVLWEVTPDFEIVGRRFTRSIINSCAKFSYEQVQSIIDDPTSNEHPFPVIHGRHGTEKIKESILFLHRMAELLRSERFDNGALRIQQTKITFSLDSFLNPVDFHAHVQKKAHQMIEEFMLLANMSVAEKLHRDFPDIAFLRCHSPPLLYVLEKLQKSLEHYGIILDISSSGSLYSSLLRYSGDDQACIARMLVLSNVVAKPMTRATYYCAGLITEDEDRRHYALNVPLYTHFTSPIRRYADVMVHRLLAASLNYSTRPNWTINYVENIASNCNKQKYAAKCAGEASTELFLAIYIGLKGGMVCEAVVSDIKDKSFDCIVLSTGSHQRIYYEHIKGALDVKKSNGALHLVIEWPADENHSTETTQVVEMFSIVTLELKRVNALKVEARLLRSD